jgi:hypothetical protein
MPETTRGYFYPGIDEAPDGPYAFEQLAESVDTDTEALDTAIVALDARLDLLVPFAKVTGGLETVTTNSEGYATLEFTVPFPGGLTAATVTDASTTLGAVIIKYVSGNATSVNFRCYASTGDAIVGTPVAVTYIATGY